MKLFKIHINTEFLLMFMMSMMNMIFLHQYFLHTIDLEVGCFVSSFFDNLLACLIDVTFILLVSWLITLRRLRASLAITFVITLLWSFCNVFYARFFHQYLSWSSIGLAGNLSDPIVLDSMTAGFRLIDIYYPLAIITFCWIYFRSKHHDVKSKSFRTLSYIWICGLLISLTVHGVYAFHPHIGIVYELEKTVFTPAKMDSMWPNWTVYHKGFFRKLFVDQLKRKSKIKLTKEQDATIEKEYSDHSQRITGRTAQNNIQNVIFILVESYLSVTSDLVVDGQEITPNLNKLKRDSNVYYNGEITVSKAKKNSIIGLPEQIKKAYPDLQSLTIIPTNPSLWDQQAMSDSELCFKRAFDVITSFTGLLLLSPLMAVIALMVRCSSKGPVLYSQERVGLYGLPFRIYKFRTMIDHAEANGVPQVTADNDPRITPIGHWLRKYRLDELPQLWNILKGEMAIVGPRPERPFFVEKFQEEIPRYMVKHQVRPGMTGWAQIHGYRGDTSIKKRIECDLYYIENWTLGLDIKILFLTIFKGFVNNNAY